MVYHKRVYTPNNHSKPTRPLRYDYLVSVTHLRIYGRLVSCCEQNCPRFCCKGFFSLSLIFVTQVQRNQFCVGTTYSRSPLYKTHRYWENHNALPLTHSTYITGRVRQPPGVIRYLCVWLTI